MPYSIEANDVTRDFFQGLYGNRIELDDPDALEIFWSWTKLRLLSDKNSKLKIGAFEFGGAQPQIDSVFLGKNPTETIRHLMEYAKKKFKEEVESGELDASLKEEDLNMIMRPLWRGANGFNLEPMAKEDLEFILEKMAKDVAPIGSGNELRIKAFDSQAVIEELRFTAEKIAQLRKKGHNVTLEIGIPYSNGEGIEPNPYPDEFFVNKFIEAAKLAKDCGLPPSTFRIGLKDMVGELSDENATRLVTKIIKALKDENIEITLGLHLHDTGLAAGAYAAAIAVAKKENWPIAIDTVNSFDEKAGSKLTGFASIDRIAKSAGKEEVNDLDLSEKQQTEIKKIAEANNRLIERYKLKRVEVALDGETLRRCKIPGGGYSSFDAAIHSMGAKQEGLADLLDITKPEAVQLAAEALVAVGRLMGEPFAVTPGFQNKQVAALNMLKNMIEAGVLKKGTPLSELKQTVLTNLNDQQVKDLFLKGLGYYEERVGKLCEYISKLTATAQTALLPAINALLKQNFTSENIGKTSSELAKAIAAEFPGASDKLEEFLGVIKKQMGENCPIKDYDSKNPNSKVIDFLQGEMPVDMHPLVREIAGNRKGTLTDGLKSRLPDVIAMVRKLQEEGKVAKDEQSFEDVVVRALILGVEKIRNAIEKPWLKEPNASYFWSKEKGYNKEGYDRAMAKYKAGLRWEPDTIEKIREYLAQGVADTAAINAAHGLIEELRRTEKQQIQQSVLSSMKEITNLVAVAAEDIVKLSGDVSEKEVTELQQPLKDLFKNLYSKQQKIVEDNLNNGYQFVYTKDQRLDIALAFAAEELAKLSADINSGPNPIYSEMANKTAVEVKAEMEKSMVRSPLAGTITQIKVSAGQSVKKGDELFVVEAAKMLTTVTAERDFEVNQILLKPKEFIGKDQALFKLKTKEIQVANTNIRTAETKTLEAIGRNLDKALKSFDATEKKIDVPAPKKRTKEQTAAQKRGANRKELTKNPDSNLLKDNNIIHLVDNRGGCASKIINDLEQLGQDYRELYVPSDASTPVVKATDPKKLIALKEFKPNPKKKSPNDKEPEQVLAGYVDQDQIIEKIKKLASENPGKKIHFHPGWGFLAEKEDFVAKLEKLKEEGVNVVFVGPKSKQMEEAGGKKTLRDLVQSVAPEFNPKYLGLHVFSANNLKEYLEKVIKQQPLTPLEKSAKGIHGICRSEFKRIKEIGGDVMLKAIAGGGGRGIQPFKYDDTKSEEKNYHEYLRLLELNVRDSERLFANGEIMAEQRIRGNTRHIEIQFAATAGQAISLGVRDCTAQNSGQKFVEINVIEGDYSSKLLAKIKEAGEKISQELARRGYVGLGTLEMLVVPETEEVKILEVNPRVQVEHGVTEKDIELKTGKTISLPVFNSFLADNPENKSPQKILEDLYALTAKQIEEIQNPGKERVVHVRINSKEVDLVNGTATPSYVLDSSWPTSVSTDIAEEHDVTLIQGGLGGGNYDPQIGAMLGKEKNVKAGLEALFKFLQVSQVSDRKYDKTNLGFVAQIYKYMFNENGTVNHEFSTKTVDSLLKTILTSRELVQKLGFYIEKLDSEIAGALPLADTAELNLARLHACRKSVNTLLKTHLKGTDPKVMHLDLTTKALKTLSDMFDVEDPESKTKFFYFKDEANAAEIDKLTAASKEAIKDNKFVMMEDKKATGDLFPGEKALKSDAIADIAKLIKVPAVAKADATIRHADSVFTPMSPPFAARHQAGALKPQSLLERTGMVRGVGESSQ
jgi:acetyl/propionyl-CoA carboxylase alpha subunit